MKLSASRSFVTQNLNTNYNVEFKGLQLSSLSGIAEIIIKTIFLLNLAYLNGTTTMSTVEIPGVSRM